MATQNGDTLIAIPKTLHAKLLEMKAEQGRSIRGTIEYLVNKEQKALRKKEIRDEN